MITPSIAGPVAQLPITVEYLDQLNQLIPENEKKLSLLTQEIKKALQEKIADVLKLVLSNEDSFVQEHQTELKHIRELAARAKQMDLLSESAKTVINGIAQKAKEVGLSYFTSPLDFTIITKNDTKNDPVAVNSDVLKTNSSYFRGMIDWGLKEGKARCVKLDISKKTLEFLMGYLHAPSVKKIDLPADKDLVFELVNFAFCHGFDDLIKKLEPVVTQFIHDQRDKVLANGYAWLYLLQERSHNSTAAKWLADLIPLILDNYDIPLYLSEFTGQYEIPIKHLDAFIDERTRDLLKELPIVFEIEDKTDYDLLLATINKTKFDSPLPIKLLCKMLLTPDQEKILQESAKTFNIVLTIEKNFIPRGTVFYGKEILETYFGEVEDVPLPEGIGQLLESDIVIKGENGEMISRGQKWKDQFMLLLKPKTVDGEPLTLNRFRNLAQHPKGGGHAVIYKETNATILEEHGNKPVANSKWVLVSMSLINGSKGLPYEVQEVEVAAFQGCEVPDLLSEHLGILTHFIHTGKVLNGGVAYTRCKESIQAGPERYQTVVGGFTVLGLVVDIWTENSQLVGMGAMRNLG